MTRFFRITALSLLLISLAVASAWGNTVMVSYDLVVDAPEDLIGSRYIRETSIDVESGVMDVLFDSGHIVFNAPGLIISDPRDMPAELEQENNLARRRLLAFNGGADTLIYMRMHFAGESEDDLELLSLEYQVFTLREGQEELANDFIQYARPDAIPVNGIEASRILVNRLAQVELF